MSETTTPRFLSIWTDTDIRVDVSKPHWLPPTGRMTSRCIIEIGARMSYQVMAYGNDFHSMPCTWCMSCNRLELSWYQAYALVTRKRLNDNLKQELGGLDLAIGPFTASMKHVLCLSRADPRCWNVAVKHQASCKLTD